MKVSQNEKNAMNYKILLSLMIFLSIFNCTRKSNSFLLGIKSRLKYKVELKFTTQKAKLRLSRNEYPETKVSINNFTKDTFKIVLPGDGSIGGRRTPIVRWSVIKLGENKVHPDTFPELDENYLGFCGNMNGAKMSEIVRLRPGFGVSVSNWAGNPIIPREVGKYSVKFYYKNIPDLTWGGIGYQNPEVLEIIRNETKEIILLSNELIFEVKK